MWFSEDVSLTEGLKTFPLDGVSGELKTAIDMVTVATRR